MAESTSFVAESKDTSKKASTRARERESARVRGRAIARKPSTPSLLRCWGGVRQRRGRGRTAGEKGESGIEERRGPPIESIGQPEGGWLHPRGAGGWLLVVRFLPAFSKRNQRRSKTRTPGTADMPPSGQRRACQAGSNAACWPGWLRRVLNAVPASPARRSDRRCHRELVFLSTVHEREERRPPEDHSRLGLASGGWAGKSRGCGASDSAAGLVAVASTDLSGHGRREWQGAN